MKRNYIITAVFLFLSLSVKAQKSYVFQILEQNSTKPVSYATIYSKAQKDGAMANEQGFFELQVTKNDTLVVTCIGYKTATILLKSLNNSQKIYLEANVSELESVVVTPNKKENKVVSVGYFKKRIGLVEHQYVHSGEIEEAVFIENRKYVNQKIIDVRINKKRGLGYISIFKVCVYSVKDAKPYENLLTKEVIFSDEDILDNKVILPVEEMNLLFPKEGVFVGLRLVGFVDKKTKLIHNESFFGSDFKKIGGIGIIWRVKNVTQTPMHWSKNGENGKWYKYSLNERVLTIGLGIEE